MPCAKLEAFERKYNLAQYDQDTPVAQYNEWKPSLQSYETQHTSAEKKFLDKRRKINLLAEARQAASWGAPSAESVGYTHSDLCAIITKLVNYIERN